MNVAAAYVSDFEELPPYSSQKKHTGGHSEPHQRNSDLWPGLVTQRETQVVAAHVTLCHVSHATSGNSDYIIFALSPREKLHLLISYHQNLWHLWLCNMKKIHVIKQNNILSPQIRLE